MKQAHFKGIVWTGLALALSLAACHKEEQAVVGVAKTAVQAEQKAQANASERDLQRAQLEKIPLPTKSMYVDIRDAAAWANPSLSVGPESISLRTQPAEAAHHLEAQIQPANLSPALVAIPATAWRYGRVIAVAELPTTNPKDRPKIRKNMEEAIKRLNDLGIVVQEWPSR